MGIDRTRNDVFSMKEIEKQRAHKTCVLSGKESANGGIGVEMLGLQGDSYWTETYQVLQDRGNKILLQLLDDTIKEAV